MAEDRIIMGRRARLAAADAGIEVEDGFIPFPDDPEAMRRFEDAWERHAPPAKEALGPS